MSRQQAIKGKYPYPPSQWNLERVQEVLSKKLDRRENRSFWNGLEDFGLSKIPLPDKFQVLAHATEEAYLIIKVGREVIKYLRKSLWYVSRDMVESRCKMSKLHHLFNPQELIAEGIVSSPFCGGRQANVNTCLAIRKKLAGRGFVNLWDINPRNVRFDGNKYKIIDFVIIKTEMGNMMDYYRWDMIDTD